MDTMLPATTARKEMDAHHLQNEELFKEYGAIHKSYLDEYLVEIGVVTQEDWNKKVLSTEGANQELRFTVMEKMFNNPPAMEFMSALGIKEPSA